MKSKNIISQKYFASIVKILILTCCFCMIFCSTTFAASKIRLNTTSVSLKVGKAYNLSVLGTKAKVTWRSSDTSIVSVNSNGRITARKAGKATITATVGKSTRLRCQVSVSRPAVTANQLMARFKRGDFSDIAGTYKATAGSNSAYGGGKPLTNLILRRDGHISGGKPLYQKKEVFFESKPFSISKNKDGSVHCLIRSGAVLCYYDVYPKGVRPSRVTKGYMKDKVYIIATRIDGGAYSAIFYR